MSQGRAFGEPLGEGMVARSRWAPSMFSSADLEHREHRRVDPADPGFNIVAASTTAFLVLPTSAVALLLPLLAARVYFRTR